MNNCKNCGEYKIGCLARGIDKNKGCEWWRSIKDIQGTEAQKLYDEKGIRLK